MHIEMIIKSAIKALENEDILLKNVVKKISDANDADQSGILRFINERFYQYVIAKALMDDIGCRVEVEHKYHDIVIFNRAAFPQVVIEIKRWMTSRGNIEIPKILYDIEKLKKSKISGEKMMMIISVNPIGDTANNMDILFTQLGIFNPKHWVESFETINNKSDKIEFWICGFCV